MSLPFDSTQPQPSWYLASLLNQDQSVPASWWDSTQIFTGVVIIRSNDNTISLVYPLGVSLTRAFRDSDADKIQQLQGPTKTMYKLSTAQIYDLARLVTPTIKKEEWTFDTRIATKETIAEAQRSFLGHVIVQERQRAWAANSDTGIILHSSVTASSRNGFFLLLGEMVCSPTTDMTLPSSPFASFGTWGEGTWHNDSGHLSIWAPQRLGCAIGSQLQSKGLFQKILAPGAQITALTSMMFDDDLAFKSQPKDAQQNNTGFQRYKCLPQNATFNFMVQPCSYNNPSMMPTSWALKSQPQPGKSRQEGY